MELHDIRGNLIEAGIFRGGGNPPHARSMSHHQADGEAQDDEKNRDHFATNPWHEGSHCDLGKATELILGQAQDDGILK
jgi:hypothetical protein